MAALRQKPWLRSLNKTLVWVGTLNAIMRRVFEMTTWAAVCFLAGAAASHYWHLDFWLSSLIAGISLMLNGFLAEREDREQCTRESKEEES
jgi:hypothetical protein